MQDEKPTIIPPQGPEPTPQPPTGDQAADVARAHVQNAYDQQPNPYDRTHQDNFDWRQYHSAWQQYYQQYYAQYYTQQVLAERQRLAKGEQPSVITGEDTTNQTKIAKLKNDITTTVKTHAKKARRSHHFIPVVSALAVGVIFLFLQFNNVLVAQVRAYVSPGAIAGDTLVIDPAASVNVGPEPKLIIPKINVDVPVDYNVTTTNESQIQLSLRDGATHYKLPGANAVPGQFGNTVILGHSSNDIFNQGKYKFVFVLLDRLEPGDTYYLHYGGKRFIYKVTEKRVIDPTEVSVLQIGTAKPMATLITCTPPGTALKRLILFGEQISPDPNAAQAAPEQTAQPGDTSLPGNEPNWLDNFWNSIF